MYINAAPMPTPVASVNPLFISCFLLDKNWSALPTTNGDTTASPAA
jgi:hypothetical protein